MENVLLTIETTKTIRDDFKVYCIRNNTSMKDVLVSHMIELMTKEKEE